MTPSPQNLLLSPAFLLAVGCASTLQPARSSGPIALMAEDSGYEVTMHGSLTRLEAKTPRQAWWEEVLYGPQPVRDLRLRNPHGMTIAQGRLLVCDQGWPAVLGIELETGKLMGVTGAIEGLSCPVDVAADERGRAFIADPTAGAVWMFSHGAGLTALPRPHDAFQPTAVLVRDTTLFVADRAGRNIEQFDLVAEKWLKPVQLSGERALAMPAGLADAGGDDLYVTDAIAGRVYRIPAKGGAVQVVVERGRRPGETVRPTHMCRTASGLLAVVDAAQQLVNLYDDQGEYVLTIEESAGWFGFTMPGGIECLPAAPSRIDGAYAEGAAREWIAVSELLGPEGVILFSIRRTAERPRQRSVTDAQQVQPQAGAIRKRKDGIDVDPRSRSRRHVAEVARNWD